MAAGLIFFIRFLFAVFVRLFRSPFSFAFSFVRVVVRFCFRTPFCEQRFQCTVEVASTSLSLE